MAATSKGAVRPSAKVTKVWAPPGPLGSLVGGVDDGDVDVFTAVALSVVY